MTRYASMRERSDIALIHLVRDGAETSLCGLPRATLDPLAIGPIGTSYRPVCQQCKYRLASLDAGKSTNESSGDLGPDKKHPLGLFDPSARLVFAAAQHEAELRGGTFLISGLIVYAAAKADDEFAFLLLEALGCDLHKLADAIDAEWAGRSEYLQDRPATLVNQAFNSLAAVAQPGSEFHLPALVAAMLAYPDSMASRVATRVGVDPKMLAERLR
jgi:hypothetical protein